MISGDRIKLLRRQANMRQGELGKKLNVSGAAIGAYERGARTPSIDVLKNMCTLFDVSSDYFLDLTDSPKKLNPYDKEKELSALLNEYKLITYQGNKLTENQIKQILSICEIIFNYNDSNSQKEGEL